MLVFACLFRDGVRVDAQVTGLVQTASGYDTLGGQNALCRFSQAFNNGSQSNDAYPDYYHHKEDEIKDVAGAVMGDFQTLSSPASDPDRRH